MDHWYLVIAYSLVWVFFFAYLLGIWKRLRSLGDCLSSLERRLNIDNTPGGAPHGDSSDG